jgi:hypothetical protein
MSLLMTIIVLELRERLRPTLRVFFVKRYVDLKKKRVGSGSQDICDLFSRFMGGNGCHSIHVLMM